MGRMDNGLVVGGGYVAVVALVPVMVGGDRKVGPRLGGAF